MSPELIAGLIVLGGGSVVGWVRWITLSVMKYNKKEEDATEIKIDFKEMKEYLKAWETRVNESLDKFDKKQIDFLKTEIYELKGITQDVIEALNNRK